MLTRSATAFVLRSAPYDAEWSGRLTTTCEIDKRRLKALRDAERTSESENEESST
jgi:hypothetical protein